MTTCWMGTPPTRCDVCGKKIGKTFVDGMTKLGPWGILCPACHTKIGVGLGLGRGQRYELLGSDWVKTAG